MAVVNGEQLSALREKAKLTQTAIADALDVSQRAVAGWEAAGKDKTFSQIEARAIRELFTPMLLDPQVEALVDEALKRIPSELVALWLVQNGIAVTLPHAIHVFGDTSVPRVESPLTLLSLTTFPLRSGEILNLAGDAIVSHPAKRFKNRQGYCSQSGICESLLHVPAFTPSSRGPRPVLLLSFENKLDEDGRVIIAKDGVLRIYTTEDERTAGELARQFRDRLLPDLELLDMFE